MIGDASDFRARLKLTLPGRWFSDTAPILDAVLSGLGTAWESLYELLQGVRSQARVRTASGSQLELAAQDYLSDVFPRRPAETDDDYRQRLLAAMLRHRATKPAISDAAAAAGYTVTIFEPAQAADTGSYNVPSALAWNSVGAWGSLQMPFESLVVARPGVSAYETELWRNIAGATPAGGAIWLRVTQS